MPSTTTTFGPHITSTPNSATTTTTTTTTFTDRRRAQNDNEHSRTNSRLLQPIVSHADGEPASRTSTIEPFPTIQTPQLTRVESANLQPTLSSSAPAFTRIPSNSSFRSRPISIQRLSSADSIRQASRPEPPERGLSAWLVGRRRSTSAPNRPGVQVPVIQQDGLPLQRVGTAASNLPVVMEDDGPSGAQSSNQNQLDARPERSGSRRLRAASDAARSAISRFSGGEDESSYQKANNYESEVVDLLDVLDPEVSTLTTLTNVQNSLFVPDLGRLINRRPTYQLTHAPARLSKRGTRADSGASQKPLPSLPTKDGKALDVPSDVDEENTVITTRKERRSSTPSIASHVQEDRFAVLPHGVSLEGWTEEEKEMLDDYVRHMLHSKRSKFKRSMRAFGKYVRRPLGFFVTLYAVLITLFGLAWVLFLIGWISVGERQPYIINVIDNVLVALFAIVGDGLAPFRAVDTYHMIYIAHYHHLSWRLRKEKQLPKLADHNDLPADQPGEHDLEAEATKASESEFSVLSPQQQKKLEHHQKKFTKSHSFYKPHETVTHYAFPLRLLVAVVVLLDCHSLFQMALGATTWGIDYKTRPKAITPTILSCSITCNITAGILIKIGDNRSRKKDVLQRMYRQELTDEAIKKVEKKVEGAKDIEHKQDKELQDEWEKKHARSKSRDKPESGSGSASASASGSASRSGGSDEF